MLIVKRIHPLRLSILYNPVQHNTEEERKQVRNDIRHSFGVFSCEIGGESAWVVDISNSGTVRQFDRTQITNITVAVTSEESFRKKLDDQAERTALRERTLSEERRKYFEDTEKKRVKGASLCREHKGFMYIAFTEDFGRDNIKINIVNAYQKGASNIRPGGFKPQLTWDSPNNWYVCSIVQNL